MTIKNKYDIKISPISMINIALYLKKIRQKGLLIIPKIFSEKYFCDNLNRYLTHIFSKYWANSLSEYWWLFKKI